ncbi:hypothetical protein GGR58DRAFT_491150 [Xylaria digitata]|nr:hypothetical protein GGR58DRAFT_491150 [Xylaria digitata]
MYTTPSLFQPGKCDNILLNLLDAIPLIALYQALQKRHFTAALSNTTTFTAMTAWKLSWTDSFGNDGGASKLLNSIELDETTVPEGV